MHGTVSWLPGKSCVWRGLDLCQRSAELLARGPVGPRVQQQVQEWPGWGVAWLSAEGTFNKKEERLSRDRSSARWLSLVVMYVGCREHWFRASTNTKQRSRCMRPGFLLDLERRQAMTTWLSQWQRICRSLHV